MKQAVSTSLQTPVKKLSVKFLETPFRLSVLAGLAGVSPATSALAETVHQPNILFILADDLGYGDLSCHGGKIPTPNIDSIAKNGMEFQQGYVTAPQCAPSRAGLITGRYQQRFGFEYNFERPGPTGNALPGAGLAVEERTMADYLRASGYHTGIIGKWHLGDEPQFRPLQRGFDEFFGFLRGASLFMPRSGIKTIPGILRNEQPEAITNYLTDVFGDEASAYIERNKDKPWFLYLSFNAPHEPWEAPQKYLDRFPDFSNEPIQCPDGRDRPSERLYAAMVSALDDAVGNTLKTLKELNLDEQTVIVFLSDNGAPLWLTRSASNGPLRGEKGDVLEGGVRVPFFVQWTGHIPSGAKIQTPASSLDLLPTFLALAGRPVPPESNLDGQNLLDTLTSGKEPVGQRTLYWQFRLSPNEAIHSWGIRQGDWKYWRGPTHPDDLSAMYGSPKTALFNIVNDIHEDHDLSAAHPEKRKELEKELIQWMKTMEPARWGACEGTKPPLASE
jgi:arylsulfatase A-like enzyme